MHLNEFNPCCEAEFVFKAQAIKLRTFPPIMTVLGVHCLLGSFLMPGRDIKRLQGYGVCVGSDTHTM